MHRVAVGLASNGVYVKANFASPVEGCVLVACGSLFPMQQFYSELEAVLLEEVDFAKK